MKALSLLVFGIVSCLFTRTNALPRHKSSIFFQKTALKHFDEALSDLALGPKGQCYEIFAAGNKIGFILSTRLPDVKRKHYFNKKTYTYIKNNGSEFEEQLKTKSDKFYKPNSFYVKTFKNSKKVSEISGHFKSYSDEDIVEYKTIEQGSKPQVKKLQVPKGSVFSSLAVDLIFRKKRLKDLSPQIQIATTSFNERTGQVENMTSLLASKSGDIKFTHTLDKTNVFTTEHTKSGELISSVDKQQNLKTLKCPSSKNQFKKAATKKAFKDLFTKKEQDILKSCCQL